MKGFTGFRAPMAVVAAAALVVLSTGTAISDETAPLEETVDSVKDQVRDGQAAPETRAPAETDADTTGAAPTTTTRERTAPDRADTKGETVGDRAEAKLVDLGIGGQDVLDVGHSKAQVGEGGRSQADSTLLAIGGQTVIGTNADSDGEGEGHAGDPLHALCEGSEGALCLRLLYADAWASQDGDRSSSRAENGVANVCVGGSSAERDQDCDGPIAVGLLESRAEAHRNSSTGARSGAAESHVADVCLGQDAGSCAIGLEILKSFSAAESGPNGSDADGDAAPVQLELGGEKVVPSDEKVEVGIPDCDEPVVCLILNQDGVGLGSDGAASSHQGAALEALDGTPLAVTGLFSDTGAATGGDAAAGGPVVAGAEDQLGGGGPGQPGTADVAGASGLLPNTGGVWSGLLALAMAAVATGAFVLAFARRRSALA